MDMKLTLSCSGSGWFWLALIGSGWLWLALAGSDFFSSTKNRCIAIESMSLKDYIVNETQLYFLDPRSVQDYKVQEAELYVIDPRSAKDYILSYQAQSSILSRLALAPNQALSRTSTGTQPCVWL